MRLGKVHQGGAQSKELLRAQRVLLETSIQRAEKGGQLISLGLYKVYLASRHDGDLIVFKTMLSYHGATQILPQSQKIQLLSTPKSSFAKTRGLIGFPKLDIAFPIEVPRLQSLLGECRLSPEPL